MKNGTNLDAIEARYRRDGFAVIENLAPPDLLRGLQSEVARVVAAVGDGESRKRRTLRHCLRRR